ncbi:MAG: diaminopimelate epimerase [Oscillospiraceae bacterium]|nr:diaminopimelate epimerase [Oscillospiraceae bacterium]
MRFTKMHGIGNDYIYINGFEERVDDPAGLSVRMSAYHTGVGSDGLILILPSDKADLRMRMFNNDGSESGMCGNGARCVARYAYERGLVSRDRTDFTLETGGGIRSLTVVKDRDAVSAVRVDMGVPIFAPSRIPVALDGDAVIERAIELVGRTFPMTCVSMGNPHAVLFVDEDPFTLKGFEAYGRMLENHGMFPEKVNVEFVQRVSDSRIKVRVWERGTGETLACGTGACASVVAAIRTGRVRGGEIKVTLRGGELLIDWPGADKPVMKTGPAEFVFDGLWLG